MLRSGIYTYPIHIHTRRRLPIKIQKAHTEHKRACVRACVSPESFYTFQFGFTQVIDTCLYFLAPKRARAIPYQIYNINSISIRAYPHSERYRRHPILPLSLFPSFGRAQLHAMLKSVHTRFVGCWTCSMLCISHIALRSVYGLLEMDISVFDLFGYWCFVARGKWVLKRHNDLLRFIRSLLHWFFSLLYAKLLFKFKRNKHLFHFDSLLRSWPCKFG